MRVFQYLGGFANGYFIIGDQGAVAVDTGCEMGEDLFLQHVKDAGINPQDIRLIIITHGHSDHYMNVEAARKLSGAPVLLHEADLHFAVNGELPDADICGRTKFGRYILAEQAKAGQGPVTDAPVFSPDIIMKGKTYDLKPYGIDGEIILTPGHSKGSLAVWLSDGSAFVADTFAEQSEETGGGPAFLKYVESPYEEVQDQIQMLLDKGAKVFYSGHGGPFSRAFVEKKLEEERAGIEVAAEKVPYDI